MNMPMPDPHPDSARRRAETSPAPPVAQRAAVAAIFFSNGFGMGNWVTRIPDVKRALSLDDATLGAALLAPALGSLLAMSLAGWFVARRGSRAVTIVAAVLFALSVPGPALAPDALWLFVSLAFLGVGNGALDVAMNANAVEVEQGYGRPIMSSFHGLFSLGGLAGAAAGGTLAHAGVTLRAHLLLTALAALLTLGAVAPLLRPGVPSHRNPGSPFRLPSRALVPLCAIAFAGMLGEGAMADWSAVYLREALGTTAGVSAAGFAAFSATMTVGRFLGDRVTHRFGSRTVVRSGAGLSALGLGLALAIGRPAAALFGLGCVGMGLSCVVPVVFSAAARTGGQAGPSIAALSTVGYLGFLVGPPAIGLVAGATSLPWALCLVVLAQMVMFALAGAVRDQ